jgi:hypothetical protein
MFEAFAAIRFLNEKQKIARSVRIQTFEHEPKFFELRQKAT